MKKILLTIFTLCLVVFAANAQRTLVDFEGGGIFTFTDQFNTGSGGFAIIENPDPSGINQSDSTGQFIEAADGDPWAGFFMDSGEGVDSVDLATGQSEICIDVWMAQTGNLSLKVERVEGGGAVDAFEPNPGVEVNTTSEWTTVCQDYAGTSFENSYTNRLVFIFNLTSTPTADQTHFFDNVVQPNVTVNTTELFRGELVKIFPNPATYNIFFSTDGTPRTILVSDMMGRTIDSYEDFTGNNIRVSGYAPGTYIMTFVDEDSKESVSTKFVKK
jgi:hypothetical protein